MSNLPACVIPSASSACGVIHGEVGAIPKAALHTVGRAALIAVGIAAMGERDAWRLAKYSVGAALAIEAFALTWAYTHRVEATTQPQQALPATLPSLPAAPR